MALLHLLANIAEKHLEGLLLASNVSKQPAQQIWQTLVRVSFSELWKKISHDFQILRIALHELAIKSDYMLDNLLVTLVVVKFQHLSQYQVHFQLLQQELAKTEQLIISVL